MPYRIINRLLIIQMGQYLGGGVLPLLSSLEFVRT